MSNHINWLRAAVLGANDGIVSTASLIVGVAAANATKQNILLTGIAGLVAGAMSMAAGEYVSVSSQADTEKADLEREQKELSQDIESEKIELAGIYRKRGLDNEIASKVATQLMEHDALGSHARDELGITDLSTAHPIQAAVASATSFATGAFMPLLILLLPISNLLIPAVAVASILSLMCLGILAARVGGANATRSAIRVGLWGAIAMAATAGIGHLIGATI